MSEKVSQFRQTEENGLSTRHLESRRARLVEDPSLGPEATLVSASYLIPTALAVLVFFRPNPSENPSVGTLIAAIGFVVCATGQSLRLWAWAAIRGEEKNRRFAIEELTR